MIRPEGQSDIRGWDVDQAWDTALLPRGGQAVSSGTKKHLDWKWNYVSSVELGNSDVNVLHAQKPI